MKLRESNKVVIGHDDEAQRIYLDKSDKKIKALENLVEYCERFIDDIQDLDTFLLLPYDSFIERFKDKTKGEFSEMIPISKRLELVGVDAGLLNELITAYQSIDIKIDLDTLTAIDKDFSICATTKQAKERYKRGKALIKAIEAIKEDVNINYSQLLAGSGNILKYNFHNQTVSVRIEYIQQGNY